MKLPISAALFLLIPAFPLTPVEAAPPLALDAGQEGTKEQRQALAKTARRMLESEREGDREEFDKHEAKLVELLKAMGASGTEAEAVALVRSVFEEFDPDALQLLDAEMEEAPGRESKSRLDGLHSALTMFMVTQNRYPTTQEGLQLLITGGEMQVPYIDEYMLLDGWGTRITYKLTDEDSFQLRSAGPDMVIGTGDDLLLSSDGSNESGEGATYGTHEAFGTLAPGDELEGLDFTEHGLIAAYRVKRGNQCLVIANGVEHSLFDQTGYPQISPGGTVVTYTAQLDGQDYLVVNGDKHAIDGRILGGVRYVGESDIFAAPYLRSSGGIKWIIGDGEWLESHSDNLYSPKVYPPVTSDDRSTVAVRAQHGDQWFVHEGLVTSEPADWASQPVAIPGKRAVAYRYGDRETTTVVINGSKVGVHDWARNPTFNADGTNYAYAIGIGGQPTQNFEAICNRDPKDDSVAGILHGPAYTGGTYNMVFNRKVGPPFAFVKDPIFNPTGTDIAYAVKRNDGKSAVHYNGTTSAGYKYVDAITFDRPGTGMAFVGTRDGLRYLVSNGKESAGHKGITQVTGGATGTFAYVNTNAQDLKFLTIGWSALGPFQDIDEVGFMPDGKTAFARVRHDGKAGVLIGHEVTRWFDEIQSFTTSQDHPTPTYMARDGEAWHVVTGNQVGPAFEKLQKPIVLGDGRVVYLALTFESKPGSTEGAPDVKEPKHHVIVDGKAQPSCIVRSDVTVSPDGFRAYYRAELEPGVHSIVEIGGRTYTPKDAKLDYVMFDGESRLVIHEVGDGYHRLVIDHVTQPAFDDLSLYSIRTSPSLLTASVTEGDKEAFISGRLTTGYFDLVTDPIYSADGQTLACRGRTDGSWHLAIGRWTSDRYDEVFPPRFTQDGKSVQCAVRVGSDLMRLTVHLDEVDWQ